MRPPDDEPDFLPSAVRLWAGQHEELLELIAEGLMRTGEWPSARARDGPYQ
jgi:hypothetical protein